MYFCTKNCYKLYLKDLREEEKQKDLRQCKTCSITRHKDDFTYTPFGKFCSTECENKCVNTILPRKKAI